MTAFTVTAQTWNNGHRVADHAFTATAADLDALKKRMRNCGVRVVSIVELAVCAIASSESGLSSCGTFSTYVD